MRPRTLVIVLIIAGVVLVARWALGRRAEGLPTEPALGILKKRDAWDEITKEEFERMRSDLA